MDNYIHGAYGNAEASGEKQASQSQSAFVYVGTAPVHLAAYGADAVNRPILVNNMAEARKYFGYSEDWAKYTLCEAMHMHFDVRSVGPIVLINVLDPKKHKTEAATTVSLTPEYGRLTVVNAEDIILASVAVEGKTKNTDYTVQYDYRKKQLVLTEIASGGLGTEALTVTYNSVDASMVGTDDVIGETDGYAKHSGLYAIRNVYQLCGAIPSFLLAPGFSCMPEVHRVMAQVSRKINSHWDAYMLTDMPLVDTEGKGIAMADAHTWKKTNGYTCENELVRFPMGIGTDGKHYHLSVVDAANRQQLLLEYDGIPFHTASNTECEFITGLYFGENDDGSVFDDEVINKLLNQNGIGSAAYIGGRWVLWGCHCADYDQENADYINVADTNRMMMYYLTNGFQHRRPKDVDKPLSYNDLKSIESEEQARLDALVKIGALTYGKVTLNATADDRSDMMNGDYSFAFTITPTPLAKSLTAYVYWSNAGYEIYFAAADE